MPIEEVKAGMVGVADGLRGPAQDFKVQILGVLRRAGPRRPDSARLEGAGLAQSGSPRDDGSPVTSTARLVGAVQLDRPFSRNRLPITPIAEMKNATPLPHRSGTGQAKLELPIPRRTRSGARRSFSSHRLPAARPTQSIGLPPSEGGQLARCSARFRHRSSWEASARDGRLVAGAS